MEDDAEFVSEIYIEMADIGARFSKSRMVGGVMHLLSTRYRASIVSNPAIQSLSRNQILEGLQEHGVKMKRQALHELAHALAAGEIVVLDGSLVRLSDSIGAHVMELWRAYMAKKAAKGRVERERTEA